MWASSGFVGKFARGRAFRPKMQLPEHAYTSLTVTRDSAAPAAELRETPGPNSGSRQSATCGRLTRLQLVMVAAAAGSAVVGTLVLLTKARPRHQQAVDETSVPAIMLKAEAEAPTSTKDPNRWVTLKFPISFEGPYSGTCPYGFTCNGYSRVCEHPPLQHTCNHPGMAKVDGKKYLLVGNDEDAASARTVPFYMPTDVQSIRWLRSGGSDAPSGVSVHLVSNGKAICTRHNGGADTNVFFEESCDNLSEYESEPVYICIINTHTGIWSKVLVDDIQIRDQWGKSLNHAGHVDMSPTSGLPCPHD